MPKLCQFRNRLGFWEGKGEKKNFRVLTNFGLQFLHFVPSPSELEDWQGYIALATLSKGNLSRECFLPWYHINSGEDLRKYVGEVFPLNTIVCRLTREQTSSYLQDLWEKFETSSDGSDSGDTSRSVMKPVTCIGRQPNSEVFVLGPELQFSSVGEPIEKDDQEFKFIPTLLKQLGALKCTAPVQSLPAVPSDVNPLQQAVIGIQRIGGENAMCGLFCLGGAILSLFYESIQRRCGSVAIPIVFGSISKGKSNMLKVALAVCNNLERGFLSHLTESSGRHKLAGSLPFVYDDPNNCEAKFKQLLVEAFGGANMENQREVITAHCVPIISANTDVVDKLTVAVPRYISRCVLLPCCCSASSVELDVLSDVLETVRAAFPQALHVGHYITVMSPDKLYSIRAKLERKVGVGDLSQQDSRMMTHYSLFVACVKKIIRLVEVPNLTSKDMWKYVQNFIGPEIIARQMPSTTSCESDIESLLERLVLKKPPLPKVLRCVNPSITYTDPKTRSSISGVAISLNLFLKLLDSVGVEHPAVDVVRKTLHKRDRAIVGRYKQYFLAANSTERKISRSGPLAKTNAECRTSIAVPQEWVSENVLNFLNDKIGTDSHNTTLNTDTQSIDEDVNEDHDNPETYQIDSEEEDVEEEHNDELKSGTFSDDKKNNADNPETYQIDSEEEDVEEEHNDATNELSSLSADDDSQEGQFGTVSETAVCNTPGTRQMEATDQSQPAADDEGVKSPIQDNSAELQMLHNSTRTAVRSVKRKLQFPSPQTIKGIIQLNGFISPSKQPKKATCIWQRKLAVYGLTPKKKLKRKLPISSLIIQKQLKPYCNVSHRTKSDHKVYLTRLRSRRSIPSEADSDLDLEQCNAKKCVIEEAPSNMRVVKWLNCDTCHLWFHGFCIKAKGSDYRKKRWLCDKCKKS